MVGLPVLILILYFVVRKRERFTYYLSSDFANARAGASVVMVGFFLVTFGGGIAFLMNDYSVAGLVLLPLCLIVPLIINQVKIKVYTLQKIEDGCLWLELRSPAARDAVYAAAVASRGPVVPLPGQETP